MAKYPIYESTATMPGQGPNVRRSYNTDTGGAEVGRAIQRFGGEVFDLGSTIHRMQGETELAEVTADADMRIQKMHAEFAGEDEDTYDAKFNETWSEIAGAEVKNGWARRQYQLLLTKTKPQQYEIVQRAKEERTLVRYKDNLSLMAAKAEETGMMGSFETTLDGAVKKGLITAEKADEMRMSTRNGAAITRQRQKLSVDPDAILAWKSVEDMQKADKDLYAKDYANLRNEANAQKAFLESQRAELTTKQLEGIYGTARTMDINAGIEKIRQSDGLNESQKVQAAKVLIGASEIWQKKGVNPWKETQDYPRLAKLRMDIESHAIKSKDEINAIMFEGNRPNLSYEHWLGAHRLFDDINQPTDEGKYSRTHPMAATYFDMLASKFADDVDAKGVFKDPAKAQEYVTMVGELESAFKDPSVWRNPTKMQAAFDGIIKPVNDEKAKSWLRSAMKTPEGYVWTPPGPMGFTVKKESGKPESLQDFVATVAQLKATDMAKAKAYYDQWKDQF